MSQVPDFAPWPDRVRTYTTRTSEPVDRAEAAGQDERHPPEFLATARSA